MFELSDFYDYCKQNNVDVIPYRGCPKPGATIRDGEFYAVFLDFSQIPTTRALRGICYHELGHLGAGALHKVDSPFELSERSEHRAKRWSAEHLLPKEDLLEAFRYGYTEPWQLAEYFDLPEEDIRHALAYWSVCRGFDFND